MRNGRYIDDNGDVGWYLNNQLHRESGPAVELVNGTRKWYLHGQLHREDGPAVERVDGSCEWWLYDKEYSLVEWIDCVDISPEQRTLLLLKWGSK